MVTYRSRRPAFRTFIFLVLIFPLLTFATSKTQQNKSFTKYVDIAGAKPVGNEQCSTCHEEVSKNYRHALHMQQGVVCEECHGPGSLHVEGGGDTSKIIRPLQRSPEQANGICLSCHADNQSVRNWDSGPHSWHSVRCTDCHDTHGARKEKNELSRMSLDVQNVGQTMQAADYVPETKVMVRPRSETIESCLRCHPTQRGEMSLPYHHPLREAKMTCVDCHDPHGGRGDKNLRASNVNQLCLSCHAQYRGPFSYQHPPVNENCLSCHSPHGSPNTNLLRVSEPALCLQCHAGHHDGANLPLVDRCTDCHGSIHGSDVPTATGGSRFVDKGPYGVPTTPPQPPTGSASMRLQPSHRSTVSPNAISSIPLAGSIAGLGLLDQGGIAQSTTQPAGAESTPGSYSSSSLTPAAYRFVNTTGYAGRVGEYDSLDESLGASMQSSYVSPDHQMTLVSGGDVVSGDDYRFASQLLAASHIRAGLNVRSFVQQQQTYPFYSGIISPDIVVTDTIPSGATYGVVRRLGNAYASTDLPKIPVRLSIFGNWQTRSGVTQMRYLDEGADANCGYCHYNSQYQGINYTTRNIGGAVDVKIKQAEVTYRHEFSSFNDRLTFPIGSYGALLNGLEPGPLPVGDTPPGNYYLNIPSPNQSHTDSVNLNWTASPQFSLSGYVSYGRLTNTYLSHRQNNFNSDESARWRPMKRLRIQLDYHQYNLVNDFTPFYSSFGNVSNHQHKAGARAGYELFDGLEIEGYYYCSGITRSNSQLWPQIYSIDNTDLLRVVPSSTSNISGAAVNYHHGAMWSARAGYEWTKTDDPGYLIVPSNNNRTFTSLTFTPANWLMLTNDFNALIQNAFPIIQRRNRLYSVTTTASLRLLPRWDMQFGHSYQQNNLNTYMSFQNDTGANYVLQESLVPYRQISQTYWGQTGYLVSKRFGLNARVSYNSARSGLRPNLDASNPNLFGNGPLITEGTFDPVLFQQALDTTEFGATQVSAVVVPEWIGQSKAYYLLPHGFNAGIVIYYGSYRDVWNPNVNGVLRTYSLYAGKRW